MPIYDFFCQQCGRKFDQLCRLQWEGTVKCPSCGQDKLSKAISLVSSHSRAASDSCSGKSCSSCSGCK